jgi:hypothetical protein
MSMRTNMDTNTTATRRRAPLRLAIIGAIVSVAGIVATAIQRSIIGKYGSEPMQTLPVGKYTLYSSTSLPDFVLDYRLLLAFQGLAAAGLLILVVAIALRAFRTRGIRA